MSDVVQLSIIFHLILSGGFGWFFRTVMLAVLVLTLCDVKKNRKKLTSTQKSVFFSQQAVQGKIL